MSSNISTNSHIFKIIQFVNFWSRSDIFLDAVTCLASRFAKPACSSRDSTPETIKLATAVKRSINFTLFFIQTCKNWNYASHLSHLLFFTLKRKNSRLKFDNLTNNPFLTTLKMIDYLKVLNFEFEKPREPTTETNSMTGENPAPEKSTSGCGGQCACEAKGLNGLDIWFLKILKS